MRVMFLSSLTAIVIAVVSFYVLDGISIDTASSLASSSVRL
jgi:uncharacterized membrane protein